MGLSWFLRHPAPMTNPAKTCTRTRSSAHNINPAPRQFSGSETNCTATLRQCPQQQSCNVTVSRLRSNLYRDTRIVNKTCTRMAKTTPYPPCTVTAFWLKYQDSARLLRRVTPTKLYRRAVMRHVRNIWTVSALK